MSISIEVASAAVAQALLGIALVMFGQWSARSADVLIPSGLSEAERARRRRGYLLGARGCQVIGVVLLVFAVATGIAALVGVEPTLRPQ